MKKKIYPAGLVRCQFEDEHCDCRDAAVVHELATEHETCLRHFGKIPSEARQ